MSTPLVIRLPEEEKLGLELLAMQNQLTLTDIARTAIKEYLKKQKTKGQPNLLLELSKIGEESGIPGPKDLSANYKKYLYGSKRIE